MNEFEYRSNTAGTPSSSSSSMSASQLMSSPGVAASRSTSSTSEMSSWYGNRCPASSSASSLTCLSGVLISVHPQRDLRELGAVPDRFLLVLALDEPPDLRQRLPL